MPPPRGCARRALHLPRGALSGPRGRSQRHPSWASLEWLEPRRLQRLKSHPSHASSPQRELHPRPQWQGSHASPCPFWAHPSHATWPYRELCWRPQWQGSHLRGPAEKLKAPGALPKKLKGSGGMGKGWGGGGGGKGPAEKKTTGEDDDDDDDGDDDDDEHLRTRRRRRNGEDEGEEGEEGQGEEEDHGSTHVRRENMAGGNTRSTHGTTGACLRRYGRARARARRATFRLPATLAQPSRVRKAVPATLALRTYVPGKTNERRTYVRMRFIILRTYVRTYALKQTNDVRTYVRKYVRAYVRTYALHNTEVQPG